MVDLKPNDPILVKNNKIGSGSLVLTLVGSIMTVSPLYDTPGTGEADDVLINILSVEVII